VSVAGRDLRHARSHASTIVGDFEQRQISYVVRRTSFAVHLVCTSCVIGRTFVESACGNAITKQAKQTCIGTRRDA